jgi:hypothetical protein
MSATAIPRKLTAAEIEEVLASVPRACPHPDEYLLDVTTTSTRDGVRQIPVSGLRSYGAMTTIPVFRGEFGLMVRFHVPRVYAMGIVPAVEIEAGNEALYPAAEEHRVVERQPNEILRGRNARKGIDMRAPEERFLPEPYVRQDVPEFDVVIAPRNRAYCASKNWPHWGDLADRLAAAGLRVFAGGIREASVAKTELGCAVAWDWSRPLDATIQVMRQGALVVAPCSGLAHLAVLCGAPLLLFTYRGHEAPGPVINSHGRLVTNGPFREVRWKEYYVAANHAGAFLGQIDGWEHPDLVARWATSLLRQDAGAAL